MNKNIKKFLSVILVFLLSVSVTSSNCMAAEMDVSKNENVDLTDSKCWCSGIKKSEKAGISDLFEKVFSSYSEWLPEIYKDKIKPWFSDLLKSDEQVNNTFVSLLYHFVKKGVINVGMGSAKFVAWAWKTLFRTPGALAEWLGGYKSNKIADKSSEIKELQRIIDLCNKNKTCKAVLSDILKNAEKN